MNERSVILPSPSFNSSYSNTRLAGIAARVAGEFDSDEFGGEFYLEKREENWGFLEREETRNGLVTEEDGGEFEFAFAGRGSGMPSPVSADEIFCNGQIRAVYPTLASDSVPKRSEFEKGKEEEAEDGVVSTVRVPLMKLFIEERATPLASAAAAAASSSSSSEADELEGVPADTYCVWRPKDAATAAESERRCRKSSSGGSSSKRWKFRDLLRRSQSDGGKDRFVFSSRVGSERKVEDEEKVGAAGKVKPRPPPVYSRDGGERRRSYLPYKQDLVGLFAGVNVSSKNLQPF
ncbi:hypothetical protein STAS_34585 [Striga asiatica]|uniref:Uncharacterized protein n=1 Tax=Striga asiatica TaxID=4170 RepID=A0A5A7RI64_STRAF|nr:hypothetical protein STAS_34585 [Striga asiatica]